MKFKTGDKVQKSKGYKFNGVVVSGYVVEGGERYDVQVDGQDAIRDLRRMIAKEDVQVNSHKAQHDLEELLMNCDGMIHIFSDKQLEYAE